MSHEVDVRALHHRATLGETLSDEEQDELERWYAQQDAGESKLLSTNAPVASEVLRQQVDESLAQLQATIERVRSLAAENAVLRCELDTLKQRLAQTAHTSAV